MKSKILLSLFISLCFVLESNAQIDKGKFLLGGNFSYSKSGNNTASNNSGLKYLSSGVQLGKVVKDNTVVGLELLYSYINYTYASAPSNKSNNYSAGIFYRKYKKMVKDFYLFGAATGSYFYTKNPTNYSNYTETIKTNGGILAFVPGVSYGIFKILQVELLIPNLVSLNYTHIKTLDDFGPSLPVGKRVANNFSFNTSLSAGFLSNVGIGFKFFL